MTQNKLYRLASFVTMLMAFEVSGAVAYAQTVKVEGLIKARSGATIILQTSESPKLTVLLTDSTDVAQVQGMLKARKKEMSMAALIPGLPIKVEGTYNADNQLVAQKIRFKGDDLEQAQAIQAGVHETAKQTQQNQAELEKQNAALEAQNAQLTAQQNQMTAQQKQLAEQKALIAANTARFGQLDDYYIYDEVTILFGNGKVDIEPQYNAPLLALAQKAVTVNGYMVQVKGYASSSGSATLNQKLSEDRADNVANFLQQQGHIPLTNMLAPGAMGESRQIGNDQTAEGEAQNRRVVVRVLQNKAIAGIQ